MRSITEHHVVFLDRDTIAPEIEVRRPGFAHTWQEYGRTQPEQVIERARGATIVIENNVPLTADTLTRLGYLLLSSASRMMAGSSADQPVEGGQSVAALPQVSDLELLGDGKGIVNLAHRALHLGVAQQKLDSP